MIIRIAQRFAGVIATLAGAAAYKLILPHHAGFWASMAVGLPVMIVVYRLLYRDGVTANRED